MNRQADTDTTSNLSKRKYRPDIDGLRAIAVILVLLYHLGTTFTPAGFLGVDIFFVISGFLITDHIYLNSIKKQFTIRNFYLKRIRRISPALIVMAMATTIAAYFILLPEDLINYAGSLIATLSSLANFYFWQFINIGYFSTDASVLPLLHTWSLGVEEQFYLVWPLLLISLGKLLTRKLLLIAIIILTLASLMTYVMYQSNGQLVYYSPLTRAFELLIGATLAIGQYQISLHRHRIIDHLLSLIGLAAIIYSTCILTAAAYPSLYILLPTIGSALVIATGKNHAIGNKILSCKPLVFVGLISYSLYLWHWPIIAYVSYLGVPIGLAVGSSIVIISLFLAIMSWRYIEQPFRFKIQFNLTKSFILLWIIPIIMSVCFYYTIKKHPHLGFNQVTTTAQQIIDNEYFGFIKSSSKCHTDQQHPSRLGKQDECSFGDRDRKKIDVLLTGDSHAMSEMGMLNVFLKQLHLKGYVATQSSSPFLLVTLVKPTNLAHDLNKRSDTIKKLIKNNKYQYVILGGAWQSKGYTFETITDHNYLSVLKTGLENSIQYIIANGATPVIVYDFPPLFSTTIHCGVTKVSVIDCSNQYEQVMAYQAKTREVISDLGVKYPQVILIDPNQIICDSKKCYSAFDGVPLYFTGKLSSHLNYGGSTIIGERYLQKYGNPLSHNQY